MSAWEKKLRPLARKKAPAFLVQKEWRAPRKRRRKEASIEEACRLVARAAGWESRKMNGMGFRDWPDRLFVPPRPPRRRRPFWVEFKRPGEEPTTSQWARIKDLRARGERVHICDSVPGFRAVLEAENG